MLLLHIHRFTAASELLRACLMACADACFPTVMVLATFAKHADCIAQQCHCSTRAEYFQLMLRVRAAQGVMLDIVSMLFTLLRAYVPAEFRWSLPDGHLRHVRLEHHHGHHPLLRLLRARVSPCSLSLLMAL